MSFTLTWPNREKETGMLTFFIHPNMINNYNRWNAGDMNASFRKEAMIFTCLARANPTMKGEELCKLIRTADFSAVNAKNATTLDVRVYHQACLLGGNMTCEQIISVADGSASITINGDDDCIEYKVVFEGDAFVKGDEEE